MHGVRVLGIGALEENAPAIDVNKSALDLDVSETIFCGKCHLFAFARKLRHLHGVEHRMLRAPQLQIFKAVEDHRALLALFALCEAHLQRLRAEPCSVGRNQSHFHRFLYRLCVPVIQREGHAHRAALVSPLGIESRRDIMVADMRARHRHKVHIAVNARHVPHVLPLKVRPIAEAYHLNAHIVFARAHIGRNIKFGRVVRPLSVTHKFSVEPNVGRTVDAVKAQERAHLFPSLGKSETSTIRAHIVVEPRLHVDERRIVGKGIFHIDVIRVAIPLHLKA